jgi:hypothetical protein
MASAIIDGTNIDVNVFSYSELKINPGGGKVVNLYNKNFKESLTISTPLMITWGAQEGQDQATKVANGKFTMSLQFPTSEYSNADTDAFLRSIKALENKVKADALTNSSKWFGKTITSSDVMDEKFNVMLRHPKKEKGGIEMDYSKPPTLTVKIPCWKGGVWQSEIYDEEGNPLFLKGKSPAHVSPLDFLKPKTHVICLIQCGGLWFVNGKLSITWNLKQAIVQKPKTSSIIEGTCFLRPKASDVARMKTLPPPEDDIDPDGASSAIVEDSDEEYELPPPPTPAVVAPVKVEPAKVEPVKVEEPVEQVVASEEPKKKRIVTKKKE